MSNRMENMYLFFILLICPSSAIIRKHLVHGRNTRYIEDYELSVPHTLTFTGDFVSFDVPHFYEANHDYHRKKRSPTDPEAVHLGIHADNKLYHVMVWPNYNLISPDLIIEIRDPENIEKTKFHTLRDTKLCYYTGKVNGIRNSRAALSTCDGLVGHITINNKRFFIEPLEDHEPNEEGQHLHVVYRRDTPDDFDASNMDNLRKCSANDFQYVPIEKRIRKSSSNATSDGPYYIETMIVCDKRFLEYHRDLNRERFILTVFNMASDYIHDVSTGQQLDLVLVRLLYLEKEEKDLDLNITRNAEKTLENFCKWQQKFNPPEGSPSHADISLLFTRLDVCYGTECEIFGQSYIGTACKTGKNCAYCEDKGLELGLVIAHQVGHLLGATNDDPKISGCQFEDPNDNTPYIMSANTNLSAIRWSPCSKEQIANFISHGLAECLLDKPPPTPYIPKPVLPGVVYDWAYQCQLIVPGAAECPTEESRALLCEDMRCLRSATGKEDEQLECFSLKKPAADGTKCDDEMWCFQGKCIRAGKRPETIDGDWSEWSDWSNCSRTCGRGVSYASRKCNNPLPANGGRYCDGDKIRYKICHPEDCPENFTTFRQQQCAEYNNVPDEEGQNHTYKAFLNLESPCSLWCTTNEDENVELDTVVKDGTRCKPGSRDVCVNGACWKVGCDNMLNSAAVEDACGICNGDGTGCKIVQETFNEIGDRDYYSVAVLPSGARNVLIEELSSSPNVISIVDRSEKHYFLNSKYIEQPNGVYKFGKVEGLYTHTAPNQEKLTIKGPLKEELVFKVLFLKRENVGYRYQYAEMNADNSEEPKFRWEVGDMGHCSARCGGGTQIGRLLCVEQRAGLVSDTFCIDQDKPIQPTQHCNMYPCTTTWSTGKWSPCDACKGKPGVQKRGVECVQENPNPVGEPILVEEDRCPDPAPGTTKVCSSDNPCKGKRYVHYIPHSHLGDVWIKMHTKPLKKVHKRSNSVTNESISINSTDETPETVDLGEMDISGTKSTLPLVCATENETSIQDDMQTITVSEINAEFVTYSYSKVRSNTTTPNYSKISIPNEGYVEDRLTSNASKFFVYPLKKSEEASLRNFHFVDHKDLPDTQLKELEEDRKKIKKYIGREAERHLKEAVALGIDEYLQKFNNSGETTDRRFAGTENITSKHEENSSTMSSTNLSLS